MALFKISKGTASELLTGNNSRYAREGSAWFTTDDGKFYIDVSGDGQTTSAVIGTNRIPLNAAQADKVKESLWIDDINYNGSSTAKVGNTVHYIVGNTSGTTGTWTGSSSEISALYAGLTIAYKIGIAGASTTTLNINGLGAKTVYRNDGKLTTHVPKNSVIILVYDGTYWRWADYDANTNTQIRVYRQTTGYNAEYPIIASRTAAGSIGTVGTNNSYAAVYGVIGDTNIPTINPSTGVITATKFNGPATHVEYTLTIKLNGGTTSTGSNPNMFEYNGSSSKTINITPAAIGALAASANAVSASKWQTEREFKISDADATNTSAGVNVDGSGNVTLKLPSTIKASITGNATSADKVNSTLTIKFNGGSNTTGSNPNMFEYNGSAGKTVNITPSGIGALGATETAVAAKKLANYYTSRPANANITHESDGSMITFKATSSMTTNKPATDGHITHWFWDNTGQYDAQLFISTGSPQLQFRTQNNGTWSAWQTVATTTGTISVADHVGHSLTIKLNGGTTEDTNLFTYNGSAIKTINITPAAIGALATNGTAVAANRLTSADTRNAVRDPQNTPNGITANFKSNATAGLTDGGNYTAVLSWRSYPTTTATSTDFTGGKPIEIAYSENGNLWMRQATNATTWGSWKQLAFTSSDITGNAATATKVNNSLTIKLNGGSTEGTNLFTYNGSAIKTINITPSAIGAVAKSGDTMTGFLTLNADPTNAMHAVTKQYADGLIAAADAMVYKGTLNGGSTQADSTYTPAANAGWTYRVATAGWINEQPVEVGDLIICNTDSTPAASTTNLTDTNDVAHKWNIIQVNVDKALYYGLNTLSTGAVLLADGVSGKAKTAGTVGSTTRPFYLNGGVPTALKYTANRLYYSASTTSFTATNHYASTTKIAINSTSAPGGALHVNGATTTTDSITVTMANTAGPKVSVSNGTYHADLYVGTGGTNHGIYDTIANNRGTSGVTNQAAGWIIYRDSSKVYIPAWNSIGGVNRPIYIDGTGHPAQVSWELKATVNSGVANRIAYYSGINAISNGTIVTDGSYLGSVSYLSVNTAHQTTYRLYVTGESYIKGKLWTQHLYPDTDTTYDLGSSSYKWRAINLAGAAAGENLLTHGINIASAHIGVNTDNNLLAIDSIGNIEIRPSTGALTTNGIIFTTSAVYASRNNIVDLGTNTLLWKDIYGHNLILKRNAGQKNGVIKFYSPGYKTWSVYMDTAGVASGAPNGATTSKLGNVTTWGIHSYIENTSGYGWIWESAVESSTATPIARMGLSSATGQLRIASNATSANNESGGLIISSAENGSNGNISLELWRGVNASWQMANEGGTLYFRNNWTNAKQTTYSQVALIMDYSTGASSIPYLAIGQTNRNTSYRLYVKGTTAHTDDIYLIGDATRNIYYQGTNTNKSMIRFVNGDANGHAIYIGGGALTVVGSGESASSFSTTSTSETLYLLSDGAINIEAGADSISNRVGLQITGAGHLLPIKAEAANNLVQDIGSDAARWRGIYIGRNNFFYNNSAPGQGDLVLTALGLKTGYPLYTDPTFLSGTNSVNVYNNAGGGTVTITRDTYTNFSQISPGTNSNYILKITTNGTATPGAGGFVQSISSRANAAFIQIFRALIPTGYSVVTASNSMGSSYQDQWLTQTAGTGKWEWYARRVVCGKEGTFSSGGHVYLSGSSNTSVTWYVAYCNCYDVTRANYDGLRTRYSDYLGSGQKMNSGTATRIAYYNDANTINSGTIVTDGSYLGSVDYVTINTTHQTSYRLYVHGSQKINGGSLQIYPVGGSYNDGIRIHARSSDNTWAAIMLCGSDNTGDTGTSAKSWFIGNNGTAFWISKNGSTDNGTVAFGHNGTNWVFKGHVVPQADSTYNLGGSSLKWKVLYLAGKADGANDLAYGLNIATSHIGVNTTNNLLGIHSTGDIQVRPGSGSILATGYIFSTTALYPTTNNTYDIGATSYRFKTGYFQTSILVGGTSYTASNSATAGAYIAPGQLELSGATPYIDFHNGNSTADYSLRIIGQAAGRIRIAGGETAANITYNSRTIAPRVELLGILYSDSWVEAAQGFVLNRSSVNGGYYLMNANVEYARAWVGTIGVAPTATTTDGTTTYSGAVQGWAYLSVGNNKICANNSTGVANNARGAIRIYHTNGTYAELRSDYWLNTSVNFQKASGNYITIRTTTSATWSYLRLHDNVNYWDIRVRSDNNASSLQFACNSATAVPMFMRTSGQLRRVGISSSWYNQRDNSVISMNTVSGLSCAMTLKTTAGSWHISTYNNSTWNERLMFGYVSDTNYNAASNTATTGVWITNAGVLMGAAWNDYAEYRSTNIKEPGRCVREDSTGIMQLTNKRLEKGCEIISDTYGYVIGEENESNSPIATSGRVLAYPDKLIETFELGMPVCSGPNGTVSQMTEEEARMYPWCIIGTVSEIPTYTEWGPIDHKIKVNGRIWIRIR